MKTNWRDAHGCVLCDEPITNENDSVEHIILAAIGGRLKESGVICASCNSKTGEKWDSALASQLHPLSLLSKIKRERGTVPHLDLVTTAGESLRVHADGALSLSKPTIELTNFGEGRHQVKIKARTISEARRRLTDIKRKYPSADFEVEKVLSECSLETIYPAGVITTSHEVGGQLAGRSMVKSVLCFAASRGVAPAACKSARDYLRIPEAEACFGYYYARDLLLNRPVGIPFHCVAVSNRNSDGQLLGYIEFFGVHRAIVCLSDCYVGADIHESYAIDPVAGKAFPIEFELGLSREDVVATYAYERIPDGSLVAAFESVLPQIFKNSVEAVRDRAISEAVDHAFEYCGAVLGEELTQEQLWKLSGLIAQKMTPFLLRRINRL